MSSLVPHNLVLASTEHPCSHPLFLYIGGCNLLRLWVRALCKDQLSLLLFPSPHSGPWLWRPLTCFKNIKVERWEDLVRRASLRKSMLWEPSLLSSVRGLPLTPKPLLGWGVERLLILFRTWPSQVRSIMAGELTPVWKIWKWRCGLDPYLSGTARRVLPSLGVAGRTSANASCIGSPWVLSSGAEHPRPVGKWPVEKQKVENRDACHAPLPLSAGF